MFWALYIYIQYFQNKNEVSKLLSKDMQLKLEMRTWLTACLRGKKKIIKGLDLGLLEK